ncbi:MAG: 16S rRNA (adenine(1518)-N(6)/adenine(1519)-N(6))-dimethyltransferase, partial [Cyanobium sp.]
MARTAADATSLQSGGSRRLAMAFQGHRARKRFGQHWLTDATVLDRIVAAAELEEG